jgi:hypothetical protein
LTSWITPHPAGLDEDEQLGIKMALGRCAELAVLAGCIHNFAAVMAARRGHRLNDWIVATAASKVQLPRSHVERRVGVLSGGCSFFLVLVLGSVGVFGVCRAVVVSRAGS